MRVHISLFCYLVNSNYFQPWVLISNQLKTFVLASHSLKSLAHLFTSVVVDLFARFQTTSPVKESCFLRHDATQASRNGITTIMASTHQAERSGDTSATVAAPSVSPPTPPSPVSPVSPPAPQGDQRATSLPPQTPSRPVAAHQSAADPLPAPCNRHQHPTQAFPAQGLPDSAVNQLPPHSRAWAYAKLTMNFLVFVAALVVLSITCSFITDSVEITIFLALVVLPVAVAAMAWSLAEIITFTVRNGGIKIGRSFKSGIHPGAHVGLNLVLWMAWTLPVAITAVSASEIEDQYYRCLRKSQGSTSNSSYGYSSCSRSETAEFLENGDRVINSDIPRLKVMLVFCALALALQFALFVGACIDTDKRNKVRQRVVYVQAPMPVMMMPPYGGWPQQPPHPPPQGMMYSMAPMHQQQPYGVPQHNYFPSQGQHQQNTGEKLPAPGPSPMMTGYYAPVLPPGVALQPPQHAQPQIPPGGYYAPSGPSGPSGSN
ncbi:hypothetical protein MN608_03435 [Microdochium nivale]|nr:hypothetical protein MN608_03435 [Microdochium nivale]